jgi:hypothetical protein
MPSQARKQLARWIKEHPSKAGRSIAARAGK